MKSPLAVLLGGALATLLTLALAQSVHAEPQAPHIATRDLGPLATGSNMLRTGLVHSSGVVFLGTYGPAPAIVWKFDPLSGKLTRVGAPGEYQLDSMVEAPNGRVYIGTAYQGLVYELDPASGRIRSLGAPPVESTPWIFTMVRTRAGEIYGARGVGLFRLDWKTGKMEDCGVVPGDHRTPGPGASNPIVRSLEERPDGLLWGDTNRWVFTFDPKTRKIQPIADVVAYDDACYGVLHNQGASPVEDLYFHVYARFSGRSAKRSFAVCRARSDKIEPLDLTDLRGKCWPCGWWQDGDHQRWLVAQSDPDNGASSVAVVDLQQQRVVERWQVPGNEMPPSRLAGPGLWFFSSARGTLYRAEPDRKRLVPVAVNPEPAACRCLATSPSRLLGAYTYDCGFAFTLDLKAAAVADHGRVDFDDHRCVYGPAAFAGTNGRYFVANHGDTLPRLWVTDLQTNRHWPAGEPAIQLVRFRDGTVWGTQGPLHQGDTEFAPERSWTPAWQARAGKLFRYQPGERRVEVMAGLGPVGRIAEAPGMAEGLLVVLGKRVAIYDPVQRKVLADKELPAALTAAVTDVAGRVAYLVLADGTLWSCRLEKGEHLRAERGQAFGSVGRGCFLLPRSRRVVGIAEDGAVSVFNPSKGTMTRIQGPAPLAAGPAVDAVEDVWYFADRRVLRYSLAE
jgi:hypothetical protein